MLRSLVDALHDLIFPPHCLSCERRLEHSGPPLLCLTCINNIQPLSSPWCRSCGEPFLCGEDHLCGSCIKGTYSFDLARSAFPYKPPLSTMLQALKFSGDFSVLPSIREMVAGSDAFQALSPPDLILPVPLHRNRLRKRTYNQAVVIARSCFPQWKGRVEPMLLIRKEDTVPQSQLSGKERRANLRNAFDLVDTCRVRGGRILIVDDVFTTGSTVNECSRVLRKAGAMKIEVFAPARGGVNQSVSGQ